MIRVNVYLPDYDEKQAKLLSALAGGIATDPGCEVTMRPLAEPSDCDIAVIFGLAKRAYRPTMAKAAIMARHKGRRLLVLESAFVGRGQYWALGFGGIHGQADFRTEPSELRDGKRWPDQSRWQKISADAGIDVKPWADRLNGNVVVIGQVIRDTNVQDTDHAAWCRATVAHFRGIGCDVVFRPHPREKDAAVYGVDPAFIRRRKLAVELNWARCVVVWNSTTGIDAILAGVPVIACDPAAMVWELARHSFDGLPNLARPPREAFLARLGYSQWSEAELRDGTAWRHIGRRPIF